MIDRIYQFRLLLIAAISIGFLPLPFILETDQLFTLLDATAISVGVGVIVAYGRGAISWFWAKHTTAGHLLVLGIFATWIAAVGRLGWLWAWRLLGRPPETDFFDHPFVAVTIYLFVVGGSLHLVANKAIDNQIPPSGWATLIVTILFGLALGFGLIWWFH